MRSNPTHHLFFYFPIRKYFTMQFKFFEFLRSLDRFKVLIRVIISEFYTAWRKTLTKICTYRRGNVCPPCPDGVDIAHVHTGLILNFKCKKIINLTKPAILFNISSIIISAIAVFVGYTRVYHMPYPYNKKNVEKLIRIIKEHKELQSHKLDEYTKQRAERQRETKEPVLNFL